MRHVSAKRKNLFTIIVIVVAVLVAAVAIKLYLTDKDAPDGMRQVKSYEDQTGKEVSCQALMPECGVCPGKVINEKCYVPKGAYNQYE